MKRRKLNPVVSPERLTLGEAEGMATHAGNRSGIDKDERPLPPRGRRRHRAIKRRESKSRRAAELLAEESEAAEYAETTERAGLQKAGSNGMETGIAKKSGNAGRAKVSTRNARGTSKHSPHTRVGDGWQVI